MNEARKKQWETIKSDPEKYKKLCEQRKKQLSEARRKKSEEELRLWYTNISNSQKKRWGYISSEKKTEIANKIKLTFSNKDLSSYSKKISGARQKALLKNHPERILIYDKDKLKDYLLSNKNTPIITLCSLVNLSVSHVLDYLRRYDLLDLVSYIPRKNSSFQQDVEQILKDLNIPYQSNKRGILENGKLELDIYVPHLNLAIECNGVYWHQYSGTRNKNYHYNKSKQCEKKGILLIQIYDYLWYSDNQDLLKSYLIKCLTSKITKQDLIDYGFYKNGVLKRDFYNLPLGKKINHKEEVLQYWVDTGNITLYKHDNPLAYRIYTSGFDIYED